MKNTLSADLYTGPTGEIFAKYEQCDQMTKLFFQYLAIFMAMKMRPKNTNCAKVSWKLCPKPNKPEIYCQRFLNLCQSGGISPNLVTLNINYSSGKIVRAKRSIEELLIFCQRNSNNESSYETETDRGTEGEREKIFWNKYKGKFVVVKRFRFDTIFIVQ